MDSIRRQRRLILGRSAASDSSGVIQCTSVTLQLVPLCCRAARATARAALACCQGDVPSLRLRACAAACAAARSAFLFVLRVRLALLVACFAADDLLLPAMIYLFLPGHSNSPHSGGELLRLINRGVLVRH